MPLLTTLGAGAEAYGFYDKPYVVPKYWISDSTGITDGGYASYTEGVDGDTYYVGYKKIVKLNKNGVVLWAIQHSQTTNIEDISIGENHVYVCGSVSTDGYWAKIDKTTGSIISERAISGMTGYRMDINPSNEYTYICGEDASGRPAAVIINSSGTLMADVYYRYGTLIVYGKLTSIKFVPGFNGGNDQVIVAGYHTNGDKAFIAVVTASTLTDDTGRWEFHISASEYYNPVIAIDSSYNIYMTTITSNSKAASLIKVNASGGIQWQKTITVPNSISFPSLIIDPDQNVQVWLDSNGFVKINSSGSLVSSYGFNFYNEAFHVNSSSDGTIVANGGHIFKVPHTHDLSLTAFSTLYYPTTFTATVADTFLSTSSSNSLYTDVNTSMSTDSISGLSWSSFTPSGIDWYLS